MASDIRRFKWIMNPAGGSHLVDNPGGRWVRYEDHEKALAEAVVRVVRGEFGQICSYCGWATEAGGGSWEDLQEHIEGCPKHPLADLRRKLDRAVEALRRDTEVFEGLVLGRYKGLEIADVSEERMSVIDDAIHEIESTEPQEDLSEPNEIAPGVVEKLRQLAENVVDIPVDLLDDDEDPCPKPTAVWERWEAYAKGESHNCEAPSTGMVRIAETFLDVARQIQTIRDRLARVDIPEVSDGK